MPRPSCRRGGGGGDLVGHRERVGAAATLDPAPVLGGDQGRQRLAVMVRGDGCEAAAAYPRDAGSLRLDPATCLRIVHAGGERLLACADLKGERALPRLRNELSGVEAVADLGGEPEPVESGRREHDRVEPPLVPLAQAGVDVAAPRLGREGRVRAGARRRARAVPVDLMSSAEWPATSTRPSPSPSSISLTKPPREPISPKGR